MTGNIDKHLPGALVAIFSFVGRDWHKNIDPSLTRLGPRFLNDPLCLIGSSRFDPQPSLANRFGLSLIMAEDYLKGRTDYQFLDGAMAVPQLAKLGSKMNTIMKVRGNVGAKFQELLRYPGGDPDNTIFELLTAAAFLEEGYDPAFVPEDPASKTPDLAVSLEDIEFYVECKRKAKFSEYECREANAMLELFMHIRREVLANGVAGKFDLKFFWSFDELSLSTIASACRSAMSQKRTIYHSWGSCSFSRLPMKMEVPLTRLYSPSFVNEVAGCEMDGSHHDGLILQVSAPNEFEVDRAEAPVVITWTSLSTKAHDRKARAVSSLFGKAISQFPKGSIGFPYICYTENNGSRLADLRTTKLMEELQSCHYSASIVVPETFVTRLYAVPDAHGNPDLIENAVQFRSAHLPADYDTFFPTLIFTRPES